MRKHIWGTLIWFLSSTCKRLTETLATLAFPVSATELTSFLSLQPITVLPSAFAVSLTWYSSSSNRSFQNCWNTYNPSIAQSYNHVSHLRDSNPAGKWPESAAVVGMLQSAGLLMLGCPAVWLWLGSLHPPFLCPASFQLRFPLVSKLSTLPKTFLFFLFQTKLVSLEPKSVLWAKTLVPFDTVEESSSLAWSACFLTHLRTQFPGAPSLTGAWAFVQQLSVKKMPCSHAYPQSVIGNRQLDCFAGNHGVGLV